MTARPRKVSDEDVFAATQRVMQRVGPGELTLASIGEEAGLTAGALVQRFGSKRALMLELMSRFSTSANEMFAELRAAEPSPLATIRLYAQCMAQMGESPATFAHHLAYLQIDLTDPDYFQNIRAHARAVREGLRSLVEEAVAAGELRADTDADALARVLELTVTGSLWSWAFHQEGTAADWMRHDIDALLAQYEMPRASAKASRPRKAARRK
jgi:AcrR family transcriptional regulator